MPKANPKVADVAQKDAPVLSVEDSQPKAAPANEPVKTEIKVVNGHELKFEDF